MNEDLRELINVMFYLADWQPDMPKNDNFFKKQNWFRKYTWTERNQEKAIEWISEKLKKHWKWVTNTKPTTKKLRDIMAREFVSNYWFPTRPLRITDFEHLIPDWQLRETMSKNEYNRWREWSMWNTQSLHWVYRHDVEHFLKWYQNYD